MEKLEYVIFERLHRRAPGIDKLDNLWEAAVLLPLVDTPDGISVLFEERSHKLRRQPGEVCFPGGHYECTDKNFRNTAVRETCEELGLASSDIKVCGQLDALVAFHGPIIHPFVGLLKDLGKVTYSKDEVEQVFTVPLKVLLAQTPQRSSILLAERPGDDFPFNLVPQRSKTWRRNREYYIYFYTYKGHVIWGLTARILYAFLYRGRKELEAFLAAGERSDKV